MFDRGARKKWMDWDRQIWPSDRELNHRPMGWESIVEKRREAEAHREDAPTPGVCPHLLESAIVSDCEERS